MDYKKRGWASEWDTVKDVLVEKWSYFFRISFRLNSSKFQIIGSIFVFFFT